MLGKLLKLDITFGYKKFLTMAVTMIAAGLLLPILTDLAGSMGIMTVFGLGLVIISILCVWLIIQHFYKNLFSSEGYLMFTLPVQSWKLLLSKVITTLLWFNVMMAAAGVMVLLLSRDYLTFSQAFDLAFSQQFLPQLLKIWAMINAIAMPMIMSLYTGLSLSTVAVRSRSVGLVPGVGVTVGLLFLFFWGQTKMTDMVWDRLFRDYDWNQPMTLLQQYGEMFTQIALSLAFSALLFFATNYIMKRRLNLK